MVDIKVRVGQQPAVKVASSLGGAQGGSLAELSDVTISNPGMVHYSYIIQQLKNLKGQIL